MDFKNFCDENIQSNDKKVFSQNIAKEDIEQKAKEAMEKYKDYSHDELMQELLRQTKLKKQNGSLDNQKLDEMYNTLCSALPPENRKNLDDIFKVLK